MEKYYRLCVLDDGIWYVVRSGTLDKIRKLRKEYIMLGYDTKIKEN